MAVIMNPGTRAALWMLGTLCSFTAMAIAGRELSADFGTFQILAVRSAIGLTLMVLLLSALGWHRITHADVTTHLLRNLAHYAGQFGWFFAIAYLPLAAVFAIEFTVPLWTLVFAALILKERITLVRVTALAVGLAGVMLILRPGGDLLQVAALAMLGGALAYGLSHTLTKKLAARHSALSILFYMMLIQLPLGLLPAWQDWAPLQTRHWPWFLLVGVTGLTAHYCMVRALALADASVVVPMDLLRLPLIALVGYLLYQERVDLWLVIGSGLIVAGNMLNVFWNRG
ncbi:DMT family transporter [Ketobacter sp.]|uniref:DMT family transporter n=1 Tax=Ketobacter sp. TaxID=2083498 RepID=UPI0025BABD59|nr:DMT family transporter [Ketobacter sp.]